MRGTNSSFFRKEYALPSSSFTPVHGEQRPKCSNLNRFSSGFIPAHREIIVGVVYHKHQSFIPKLGERSPLLGERLLRDSIIPVRREITFCRYRQPRLLWPHPRTRGSDRNGKLIDQRGIGVTPVHGETTASSIWIYAPMRHHPIHGETTIPSDSSPFP